MDVPAGFFYIDIRKPPSPGSFATRECVSVFGMFESVLTKWPFYDYNGYIFHGWNLLNRGDDVKLTYLTGLRLVMFMMVSYIYYTSVETPSTLQLTFVLIAGTGFILNHFLLWTTMGNRYYPIPLALDFVLITGFVFFYPDSSLYLILFGVSAVTLFLIAENKKVLWGFSLAFFLIWGGCLYYIYQETGTISVLENIINFTLIVFEAIVGRLIHKLLHAQRKIQTQFGELQDTHGALTSAHEQLHHYSRQVEELTMVRERNRISGEIHDTVGHKMTALLIQLQAARELLDIRPETSREKLQLCEDLVRNTLQEIRLSVRTLKDGEEPQPFITTIRKLLEDYQVMTGLSSSFTVKGDVTHIPVSVQLDLTRLIQESITNAVRHGQATGCSVRLVVTGSLVEITIQDDGTGAMKIDPGFGLKNMRERVGAHGGTILFESNDSEGFLVKARVPLEEMNWQWGGA
ncbi:sensor histidine kinase [Rossellomorea sp. AcN35-11]|nr:sensor histidine kinase [Rossellomorea aquimaris]WJV31351.1 sensor histidine kinase [Rossellomorea sp. AcN35-11]